MQVGQIVVAGMFPEFEIQTAALLDPLRGKRLTVAQIYEIPTNALNLLKAGLGSELKSADVGGC